MCEGSDLLGLKDSTLFCLFCTYQQILLLIGSTWGLMVEMVHYLTSQTKNKVTVTLETDQIAQILFFHWHLPSQGYNTTGFQTSGHVASGLSYRLNMNHSFREFFVGGI